MSLSKICLNYLNSEQLNQVVELDNSCLGGLWTKAAYQREINSPNSTLLAIYLLNTQTILGFACLWSILEEAHITLLLVRPAYQGQGLGQLLLFSLLEDAVKRGLERATLEVRASNQVALSLYQKFGFKIAGRRKKYYAQTEEDALILWRGDLIKKEFQDYLQNWQEEIETKLRQHQLLVV